MVSSNGYVEGVNNMKKAEIMIINVSLSDITDKRTGEFKKMTKITYAMKMANNTRTSGYAILVCYKMDDYMDKLKDLCMKLVVADIEERPTDNGSKYVLVSVNGKEIK